MDEFITELNELLKQNNSTYEYLKSLEKNFQELRDKIVSSDHKNHEAKRRLSDLRDAINISALLLADHIWKPDHTDNNITTNEENLIKTLQRKLHNAKDSLLLTTLIHANHSWKPLDLINDENDKTESEPSSIDLNIPKVNYVHSLEHNRSKIRIESQKLPNEIKYTFKYVESDLNINIIDPTHDTTEPINTKSDIQIKYVFSSDRSKINANIELVPSEVTDVSSKSDQAVKYISSLKQLESLSDTESDTSCDSINEKTNFTYTYVLNESNQNIDDSTDDTLNNEESYSKIESDESEHRSEDITTSDGNDTEFYTADNSLSEIMDERPRKYYKNTCNCKVKNICSEVGSSYHTSCDCKITDDLNKKINNLTSDSDDVIATCNCKIQDELDVKIKKLDSSSDSTDSNTECSCKDDVNPIIDDIKTDSNDDLICSCNIADNIDAKIDCSESLSSNTQCNCEIIKESDTNIDDASICDCTAVDDLNEMICILENKDQSNTPCDCEIISDIDSKIKGSKDLVDDISSNSECDCKIGDNYRDKLDKTCRCKIIADLNPIIDELKDKIDSDESIKIDNVSESNDENICSDLSASSENKTYFSDDDIKEYEENFRIKLIFQLDSQIESTTDGLLANKSDVDFANTKYVFTLDESEPESSVSLETLDFDVKYVLKAVDSESQSSSISENELTEWKSSDEIIKYILNIAKSKNDLFKSKDIDIANTKYVFTLDKSEPESSMSLETLDFDVKYVLKAVDSESQSSSISENELKEWKSSDEIIKYILNIAKSKNDLLKSKDIEIANTKYVFTMDESEPETPVSLETFDFDESGVRVNYAFNSNEPDSSELKIDTAPETLAESETDLIESKSDSNIMIKYFFPSKLFSVTPNRVNESTEDMSSMKFKYTLLDSESSLRAQSKDLIKCNTKSEDTVKDYDSDDSHVNVKYLLTLNKSSEDMTKLKSESQTEFENTTLTPEDSNRTSMEESDLYVKYVLEVDNSKCKSIEDMTKLSYVLKSVESEQKIDCVSENQAESIDAVISEASSQEDSKERLKYVLRGDDSESQSSLVSKNELTESKSEDNDINIKYSLNIAESENDLLISKGNMIMKYFFATKLFEMTPNIVNESMADDVVKENDAEDSRLNVKYILLLAESSEDITEIKSESQNQSGATSGLSSPEDSNQKLKYILTAVDSEVQINSTSENEIESKLVSNINIKYILTPYKSESYVNSKDEIKYTSSIVSNAESDDKSIEDISRIKFILNSVLKIDSTSEIIIENQTKSQDVIISVISTSEDGIQKLKYILTAIDSESQSRSASKDEIKQFNPEETYDKYEYMLNESIEDITMVKYIFILDEPEPKIDNLSEIIKSEENLSTAEESFVYLKSIFILDESIEDVSMVLIESTSDSEKSIESNESNVDVKYIFTSDRSELIIENKSEICIDYLHESKSNNMISENVMKSFDKYEEEQSNLDVNYAFVLKDISETSTVNEDFIKSYEIDEKIKVLDKILEENKAISDKINQMEYEIAKIRDDLMTYNGDTMELTEHQTNIALRVNALENNFQTLSEEFTALASEKNNVIEANVESQTNLSEHDVESEAINVDESTVNNISVSTICETLWFESDPPYYESHAELKPVESAQYSEIETDISVSQHEIDEPNNAVEDIMSNELHDDEQEDVLSNVYTQFIDDIVDEVQLTIQNNETNTQESEVIHSNDTGGEDLIRNETYEEDSVSPVLVEDDYSVMDNIIEEVELKENDSPSDSIPLEEIKSVATESAAPIESDAKVSANIQDNHVQYLINMIQSLPPNDQLDTVSPEFLKHLFSDETKYHIIELQ